MCYKNGYIFSSMYVFMQIWYEIVQFKCICIFVYYCSVPVSITSSFTCRKWNWPDAIASIKVWKVLTNGQAEVRALRRKLQGNEMKVYRAKKNVDNVKALPSHIKKHDSMSEEVSEILKVGMNDNCKERRL